MAASLLLAGDEKESKKEDGCGSSLDTLADVLVASCSLKDHDVGQADCDWSCAIGCEEGDGLGKRIEGDVVTPDWRH